MNLEIVARALFASAVLLGGWWVIARLVYPQPCGKYARFNRDRSVVEMEPHTVRCVHGHRVTADHATYSQAHRSWICLTCLDGERVGSEWRGDVA
jgi:hypothetical protein